MCLGLATANAQTNTYSTANVCTNVAPAGAGWIQVKLWGAGGGNGAVGSGGGGAFALGSLPVSPGDTYVTVVGQRGGYQGATVGGAGSGNTVRGAPGVLGDYNAR